MVEQQTNHRPRKFISIFDRHRNACFAGAAEEWTAVTAVLRESSCLSPLACAWLPFNGFAPKTFAMTRSG
jgi:hypothetical protein